MYKTFDVCAVFRCSVIGDCEQGKKISPLKTTLTIKRHSLQYNIGFGVKL